MGKGLTRLSTDIDVGSMSDKEAIRACIVDRERRKGGIPTPDNLEELLNKTQFQALSGMKHSEWELWFVRRPLFQEPVPVVHNTNDGRIGIMDKDGSIRIQTDIKVRELDKPDSDSTIK
jgi:hypothetical protein